MVKGMRGELTAFLEYSDIGNGRMMSGEHGV